MNNRKKECPACGELYDSRMMSCPWCGCPADFGPGTIMRFPGHLWQQYEVISCRQDLSGTIWRVRGKRDGVLCRLRVLPQSEETAAFLRILEKIQKDGTGPGCSAQIFRISRGGHGEDPWYSFECIDDMNLQDLIERENPVGEEQAEILRESMRSVMDRLGAYGFAHGCLDLSSFALRGDSVVLTDYGDGHLYREDARRIAAIYQRLRKGYWGRYSPAAKPGKPVLGHPFGKQRTE